MSVVQASPLWSSARCLETLISIRLSMKPLCMYARRCVPPILRRTAVDISMIAPTGVVSWCLTLGISSSSVKATQHWSSTGGIGVWVGMPYYYEYCYINVMTFAKVTTFAVIS